MLKLYRLTYFRIEDPTNRFTRYVMAYNKCHAVNLLYREFDTHGELNVFCHCDINEVSCINPAQFKNK